MALFLASESARVLRGLAGVLEPAVKGREGLPSTEYRIDDLARIADVSVRNVRVYQDRGLLPPPRREGRTGWYNESHLARLNLIGRMLDRGYTFATISELLTAAQYGMRVEDVLDTDRIGMPTPDGADPAVLSPDELRELFGLDGFDRNLADALASGLVKPEGQSYRVAGGRLLDAAKLLTGAGVPMAEILAQAGGVRSDLVDVAQRFVGLVTDRYLPGDGTDVDFDEKTVAEVADLVSQARALVHDVVQSLLVDAMEEAIATALEELAQRMTRMVDASISK